MADQSTIFSDALPSDLPPWPGCIARNSGESWRQGKSLMERVQLTEDVDDTFSSLAQELLDPPASLKSRD